MTLAEYAEQYLALKSISLAPLTLQNYSATVKKHIIPFFGAQTEVAAITVFDVQRFVFVLSRQYKAVTVRRKYSVLRSLLRKAAAYRLCDGSALCGVELPKVKKAEIQIFDDDSIFFLLSAIQREQPLWALLFSLALDTGARRGELAALRWEDWDRRQSSITIQRSAYKDTTTGGICLKEPKSGLSRVVSVSETSNISLMRFQRLTGRLNGFIFSFDGINPVYVDTISRHFGQFLAKNGLKKCHFHALRHTSATLLLQKGVDIKTVSARLGHSSIAVTEIYLHRTVKGDRQAAAEMNKLFFG